MPETIITFDANKHLGYEPDIFVKNSLSSKLIESKLCNRKATLNKYNTVINYFKTFEGRKVKEQPAIPFPTISIREFLNWIKETKENQHYDFVSHIQSILTLHNESKRKEIKKTISTIPRTCGKNSNSSSHPFATSLYFEKAYAKVKNDKLCLTVAEFIFRTGASMHEISYLTMDSFKQVDKDITKVTLTDKVDGEQAIEREALITTKLFKRVEKNHLNLKSCFDFHKYAFATKEVYGYYKEDRTDDPEGDWYDPEDLRLKRGRIKENLRALSYNLGMPFANDQLLRGCAISLYRNKRSIQEICDFLRITTSRVEDLLGNVGVVKTNQLIGNLK